VNKVINESFLLLKEKEITNPELDLRILLKHASYNKKDIILSNLNIENIDINYFKLLISKRLKYEPVSKIINSKFFWKHEFFVNHDVLDPRPESELIIEETLFNVRNKNKKLKILDIGTGSGCLAISLAKEFKNSLITAIDISDKALKVANKNIIQHKCENQIKLKLTKLDNINDKFDIIVSNPPYVEEKEYKNLQKEIQNFEPKIALIGGKSGLKFYKLFARKIEKFMKRKSLFICEIGQNQENEVKAIFNKTNLILKKITKDVQNIDRTLTFFKI
tara:strand:+ start:213 stop:1043 length:831 start_codon:yes stop_codon:yes gene_type:complete